MCEIEKSGRGRPGRGVVLEIRTHPDKGRGGGLKFREIGGRPLIKIKSMLVT